jgi:hypothetical protein
MHCMVSYEYTLLIIITYLKIRWRFISLKSLILFSKRPYLHTLQFDEQLDILRMHQEVIQKMIIKSWGKTKVNTAT